MSSPRGFARDIRRLGLTLATGLALLPFAANAKPAALGIVELTQPDGSIIPVRIVGDEFAHRYLSEDGYLLAENSDGMLCYAIELDGKIVASDVLALPAAKRSVADAAFLSKINPEAMVAKASIADQMQRNRIIDSNPSTAGRRNAPARLPNDRGINLLFDDGFYSHGAEHAIVVLVQYKDVRFTTEDIYDYFHRALNEEGFSTNGGTGSAYDFFNENSLGQFTPIFDVYGPLTLKNNRSYYGGNDAWGTDKAPEEMVIEACQQLDDTVDFSIYDTDGDGYIDNVFVFYAGKGEADGGGATTVWPHSWNVESGANKHYSFDGKMLDRYACSNEIDNQYKRVDGIGTFVHEFSHVMGLPDLYSTQYNSGTFTPGQWDCLDYGPYNNEGRTPPNYSAFERYALGWMQPREFVRSISNFELPVVNENTAYIVPTEEKNEFFLIEKREKRGWDAFIPASGMLVWYIDYDASIWSTNSVNNTPQRQRVDIIEADGKKTDGTRPGDCFPGSYGINEFSATTMPSFKSRMGKGVGVEFYNIEYDDFDVDFPPLTMDVKLKGREYETIERPHLYLNSNVNISYETPDEFDYVDGVYTITVDGLEYFTIAEDKVNEFNADLDPTYVWKNNALIGLGEITADCELRLSAGYKLMEVPSVGRYTITVDLEKRTLKVVSTTGISDTLVSASFDVNGRTVTAGAQDVEVYSIDGRKVGLVSAGSSREIGENGIYILKSGLRTSKLIIR